MIAPDTETALADAIKSSTGPLSIRGGGTRCLSGAGTPLSVAGLSGITLYEPGALTLVVKAGTPVSDITDTLAAEGQQLAFEPMDHRVLLGTEGSPTIGGVLAANVSGPRRIQGGAARDYALGVRFVDGSGSIIKNGGRVMKNVTGYDLVKLMAGSHGTLGVLTEVSLKVLPIPETQATLMIRDLSDNDAIRAMAQATCSPYEVSGAAHGAKIDGEKPVTLLRIEGFEASVAYRIEALKNTLSSFDAEMDVAGEAMSKSLWESVRDVTQMRDLEGDVWRVSCKPSQAATLADKSGAEGWYFDRGGGLIWIRTRAGSDLRAHLGTFEGHATLVRADEETRSRLGIFHPEAAGVARLSAGLRARFDPRGILNTGLMEPVTAEAV
jgi:glycolate oxidase FAD binding subunit